MPKVDPGAWDLDPGLLNDINGYIANARFGVSREEYANQVMATNAAFQPVQFIVDIHDPKSDEFLGSQGYSVGSGWEPSEDGQSISHPTKRNVVQSSLYGQLQARVVKELGVDMAERGYPTDATIWNGLTFHWMQEDHATVGARKDGSNKATGLMPTEYIGEAEEQEAAKGASGKKAGSKKAAAGANGSDLVDKLTTMAQSMDKKAFQKKAMAVPGVTEDGSLMDEVLDGSDEGFWAKAQE